MKGEIGSNGRHRVRLLSVQRARDAVWRFYYSSDAYWVFRIQRLRLDRISTSGRGATVGLGLEWAFADNWLARAEWEAILLQNQTFTVSGTAFGTDTITVTNRSINMFTAAVNYKLGGWGY
jgi:opacity protein-like surface antigen